MGEYRIERFNGTLDDNMLDSIAGGYYVTRKHIAQYWQDLDVFGDTKEFLQETNATPEDEKALERLKDNLIVYFERCEFIVLFQVDSVRGHFHPWVFNIEKGPGLGKGYMYLFSNTTHLEEVMAKLREVGTDIRNIVPVKINYDLLIGMLKDPRNRIYKFLMDPFGCAKYIYRDSMLKMDYERRGLPPEDYLKPDPIAVIQKEYSDEVAKTPLARNLEAEARKKEALARYLVDSELIVPINVASGNTPVTTSVPEQNVRNALMCFSSFDEFHKFKTMVILLGKTWSDDVSPLDAGFEDIVYLLNDFKCNLDGITINCGNNPVVLTKAEIMEIAENKEKYMNL